MGDWDITHKKRSALIILPFSMGRLIITRWISGVVICSYMFKQSRILNLLCQADQVFANGPHGNPRRMLLKGWFRATATHNGWVLITGLTGEQSSGCNPSHIQKLLSKLGLSFQLIPGGDGKVEFAHVYVNLLYTVCIMYIGMAQTYMQKRFNTYTVCIFIDTHD